MTLKRRLIICLVSKSEDAFVFSRQIAEECRIQQQRMIAIVIHVFGLQRNIRIVIVQEDRLAWFEHRHSLTMNSRRVEHEYGASHTVYFQNVFGLLSGNLITLQVARMLPPMTAFDVVERAT